jgi:hypothetical protein
MLQCIEAERRGQGLRPSISYPIEAEAIGVNGQLQQRVAKPALREVSQRRVVADDGCNSLDAHVSHLVHRETVERKREKQMK